MGKKGQFFTIYQFDFRNHKKKTNQSNNKPDKNVRSKDSNPVKSKAPPVIQYNSRGIPNPPPHYPPPGHHPYGMPVMRPAPPMVRTILFFAGIRYIVFI